ncbi:LysR family transcriptional regulator [Rhodospirillum sp. A1_3_36]|uniref:LysR family transcriptional regulator n=1 Tax=Rhodospirillum sp. A1_3_36 TaxID=3391666 RepID=UPI0039A4FF98
MRARQLEVFTAMMRAGSVTGAAHMLNISQPALSQILRHTEDELGFALFDREKGRLKPTPEAMELYPEAERLVVGMEGLRRKTEDLRQGKVGIVRIAASTPPGLALLPRAMAEFRARHPDIALRSHVTPMAGITPMLRAGDVALALALDDRPPPDIQVEPLGRVAFRCLLPENHPLTEREALTFADLEAETVISYGADKRPHEELVIAARSKGQTFHSGIEVGVSISAVGFVQAGLGVAVVDAMLPWEQFAGIAVRRLVDGPTIPFCLLTLCGRALSRAEEVMADQIRTLCAARGDWS